MHTAIIDWGDGKITSALINETAGSFSGAHAYATGGIYDILVTLSDDNGGTAEKQSTALVTGVRVKDGELQVVGTHGNDRVDINQVGKKLYKVHADFLPGRCHFATFDVADVESIRVLLGDGNDHASIADNIDLPVVVDGGAGNDHLNAGRDPAVLIGGDGNDKLFGSGANDKILGGNGNDVIFGSCGNDTILGGDGNDWIFGGRGNDVLDGGNVSDLLIGGHGNDILRGGPGNDMLIGGTGHDTLDGGSGNNRLIDWSKDWDCHVHGHGAFHHMKVSPCVHWVKGFVIDFAANNGTHNPNSEIKIVLPVEDHNQTRVAPMDRRRI